MLNHLSCCPNDLKSQLLFHESPLDPLNDKTMHFYALKSDVFVRPDSFGFQKLKVKSEHHMTNLDKQTYFLSLNFTHVDSTTHNFIFSFHVSSLSNGYHPASWFNTQAKANLFILHFLLKLANILGVEKDSKYHSVRNQNSGFNTLPFFSCRPNLTQATTKFEILMRHGDIESNPGPPPNNPTGKLLIGALSSQCPF